MELGISIHLKDIIMQVISNVQMKVNCHGNKGSYFKSKKELREGDPISPFLFVLWMDKFSHLIMDSVDHNLWVGIKASRKGPMVSHLMFLNNILLFGQAIESQIVNTTKVIDDFCASSGKIISKEKIKIMFSFKTPVGIRMHISTLSGFREVNDLGLYLGVPLSGKSHRLSNY